MDLLADCIRGCRAVFMTVTMDDDVPGCTVFQEMARSVVLALRKLGVESNFGAEDAWLVLLSSP